MGGPCDSPYAAPDCEAKQKAKRKKRKAPPIKVAPMRAPTTVKGMKGARQRALDAALSKYR